MSTVEIDTETTRPRRIQRRMTKNWRAPVDSQGRTPRYVGRPGRFGNPFRIYQGHTSIGPMWHVAVNTWGHIPADECIYFYVTSSSPLGPEAPVELYRRMLEVRLRDEPERLRGWLWPLMGRDLMCWCPLDQPCHADVLLELAASPLAQAREGTA